MAEERTVRNLQETKPLYTDSYQWSFYEGGQTTEQIKHEVDLEIVQPLGDKITTILIAFGVVDTDAVGIMTLRLSPYEFNQLNALFKRASFRLEKI